MLRAAGGILIVTLMQLGCSDGGQLQPPPDEVVGCSVSERTLDDGSCQPPGVPAGACATGWTPSGLGTCEPQGPPAPCVVGEMALPDEGSCREVSPCGAGPWGDVPLEAGAQFVDANYPGADSDGSETKPWTTLGQALAAASPGGQIVVAEGSYAGDVTIGSAPVRIWGRCPALVTVVGTVVIGDSPSGANSAGSELHGLAVRGGNIGVLVNDALAVVLDSLWIHDTGSQGIIVADDWGPSGADVRNVLVEATGGIAVLSSRLSLTDSVVRDSVPTSSSEGRGLFVASIGPQGGPIVVRNSVFDRNVHDGISVSGLAVDVEASVIAETWPDATGKWGVGIAVQNAPTGYSGHGSIAVRQSLLAANYTAGILAAGADAVVEHTTIRDTFPLATGLYGRGVVVSRDATTDEPGVLTLVESTLERNTEVGVGVVDSTATLRSSIIRDTQPRPADLLQGIGVINSFNTDAGTGPGSDTEVYDSELSGNSAVGISVLGSRVGVENTLVRDTSIEPGGLFGDGLIVYGGGWAAELWLTRSRVERSGRAGVVNFSAITHLAGTALDCNPISIDGETYDGEFTFDDQGGNACGCGDATEPCRAISSQLAPPDAL